MDRSDEMRRDREAKPMDASSVERKATDERPPPEESSGSKREGRSGIREVMERVNRALRRGGREE